MNLSPDWVPMLEEAGFFARHWSEVGDPGASDREIMAWAVSNHFVVMTYDLDFGAILAASGESGPSVLLLRGTDVLPQRMGTMVIAALREYQGDLASGAIVVVEEGKDRVRILPI